MRQFRTLDGGWDVPNASLAAASVAHGRGAEIGSLGRLGPRQADLDPRTRTRPSAATPLVFVSAAGPCGDGLSRDRSTPGDDWGGVASSPLPTKAGARVQTDRREAMPWARLRRSGALTRGGVPTVADEARRDRSRARDEARGALTAAQCRLQAFGRRPERRDPGQAPGGPAHLRGRSDVICPPPCTAPRLPRRHPRGPRPP